MVFISGILVMTMKYLKRFSIGLIQFGNKHSSTCRPIVVSKMLVFSIPAIQCFKC